MKMLLVALVLVTANAEAATYYGNSPYSRSIRKQCESDTRIQTRYSSKINLPAAKRCFNEVVREDERRRNMQSDTELNEALTDYFRDRTRLKNRRKK